MKTAALDFMIDCFFLSVKIKYPIRRDQKRISMLDLWKGYISLFMIAFPES